MIPIAQHDEIQLLSGTAELDVNPLPPYSDEARAFLVALASALRADQEAARMVDVMAFAFWIRSANLERLRRAFAECDERLGLGVLLHITPSNVPVNFAFSYVFGLLAGNANMVRVPSRTWPQITAISSAMNRVFESGNHERVRRKTAILRYPRNDKITADLSAQCSGRIVWGGDGTIADIRRLPLPPRAVELVFADRYSLCVLGASAMTSLSDKAMHQLARRFYNDTYLVDQNACSSPHLVFWNHAPDEETEARFWNAVERVVRENYALEPIKQVDKYTRLLRDAVELDGNAALCARHQEYLYRVKLKALPTDMEALRGRYGYFYEYHSEHLDDLAPIVTSRYQTLTYFGVSPESLRDLVIGNRLSGIDRIVPVGRALDLDVTWDGYDIIRSLSRFISVSGLDS